MATRWLGTQEEQDKRRREGHSRHARLHMVATLLTAAVALAAQLPAVAATSAAVTAGAQEGSSGGASQSQGTPPDARVSPRRASSVCSCPAYHTLFIADGAYRPPLCPFTATTTTSTTVTTTTVTYTTVTYTMTTRTYDLTTTLSEDNSSNDSNATPPYTEVDDSDFNISNISNITTNDSNTTTITTTTFTTTTSTSTTSTSTSTTSCQCYWTTPVCENNSNSSQDCTFEFNDTNDTSARNFSNDTVVCACFLIFIDPNATTTVTTTTTSSTSTTNTSTTSTSTTSTSTTTTSTSTVTTTTVTTTTVTTTTSTTSTSTTTTTTTTTTTRAYACGVPCELYPRVRCKNAIEAGEACSTPTVSTPCVEDSWLTFDCPYGNGDPLLSPSLRNITLFGSRPRYRTRCRVCGIGKELNDTDPREGWIAGNLSFGPNALDGYVNEGLVYSYAVYFVDNCGVPIGDPVARVPKQSGVPGNCCDNMAYRAEVVERIPAGSDRLVILPLTSAGPLQVGELTDVIYDWVINKTADHTLRISGAVPSMRTSWSLASVTFVTAASLLTACGS